MLGAGVRRKLEAICLRVGEMEILEISSPTGSGLVASVRISTEAHGGGDVLSRFAIATNSLSHKSKSALGEETVVEFVIKCGAHFANPFLLSYREGRLIGGEEYAWDLKMTGAGKNLHSSEAEARVETWMDSISDVERGRGR